MLSAVPSFQSAGTVSEAWMGIWATGMWAGYRTTEFHSSTVILALVAPFSSEPVSPGVARKSSDTSSWLDAGRHLDVETVHIHVITAPWQILAVGAHHDPS